MKNKNEIVFMQMCSKSQCRKEAVKSLQMPPSRTRFPCIAPISSITDDFIAKIPFAFAELSIPWIQHAIYRAQKIAKTIVVIESGLIFGQQNIFKV